MIKIKREYTLILSHLIAFDIKSISLCVLCSYEYELVVIPGVKIDQTVEPLLKIPAKKSPISVNPNDLGGSIAAGKVFTMGVRAKSSEVSIFELLFCFFYERNGMIAGNCIDIISLGDRLSNTTNS